MKEIFVQYAAYHAWANNLLLQAAVVLPEEELTRERVSSFPGLYKTVLHLLDAESIWWQRLKLQEREVRPSDSFTGTFAELVRQLQQQNGLWVEWTAGATEAALRHEFIYYNSRKERFKQPVFQMLLHLFNHGTYHRGQLVTMLRQAGVEKIPQTDFIAWSRKKTT